MSAVVTFDGGANWTLPDAFNQNLMPNDHYGQLVVKSHQFIILVDDREVVFRFYAASMHKMQLIDGTLNYMYNRHASQGEYPDSYSWLAYRKAEELGFFVETSSPIDFVPELYLMAKDESWYKLPMNWFGKDGTTPDQMFFGSVNFMDNGKLLSEYVPNRGITISCCLPDEVKALKTLAEIDVMKNISDATLVKALISSKVINSALIKQACLNHVVEKTKANVLALPGIDQLDSELAAELLANAYGDDQ